MSGARPSRKFAGRRLVLRAGAAAGLAAGVSAAMGQPSKPPAPLKVVAFSLVPFGLLDASGRPAGMIVDFQKLLAAESGLAMDVQVVPYPRAVAMMVAGDADLLFSFPNAQLREHAHSLGVIGHVDVVVMGLAGSRYGSAEELRGKRVGHIRGAEYDMALQSDPAVARYETVTYEQTVRMLLEGRYDAMLGVRPSFLYTMRRLGVPRQKLGPELVLRKGELLLHYSNKRYKPQTAATLVRALAALRERGALAALFKAYEDGGMPP
ncbi:substrate-binding periplasmic protein [Pseudoduganella aquatica]|uniref:Transporter substrate-binding domain-containing protein n=1 Tax=Pseudoduganella aquatica TaxID=2660641 RepID=A0A7X4KKQ4_9BURK|nr:transporter substrate-binding domain-containing protein [Pseudoduganella aquatica]MYN06357.1 transporter substrate-binding domain-containing protein [Pseudoduganella aquatica]